MGKVTFTGRNSYINYSNLIIDPDNPRKENRSHFNDIR